MKKGGVAVLKGRLRPGGMVLVGLYPPQVWVPKEKEKGQKA